MKQLTWLALFVVMLLHAVGLLVGCQTSEAPVSSQPAATEPVTESKVLVDPAATTPALRGALIQPTVVSARAMLESEGYSYVEANSLVLIQQTLEQAPGGFDPAARGPRPPRDPSRVDRVRTDTVSWMAFENPTHDPANHTAVLHFSNGDRSGTVLVELNVGGETPVVVRQGPVGPSGFVAADIGAEGWLACVLAGGAATVTRCMLSNCLWGQCAAIGSSATLVGCTVSWLVDKYWK